MKRHTQKKLASLLIIVSFMLPAFSCKKATLTGNNNIDTTSTVAKKCDVQHHCPPGYSCDSGYCKIHAVACNCSIRPVPPQCAAACGP